MSDPQKDTEQEALEGLEKLAKECGIDHVLKALSKIMPTWKSIEGLYQPIPQLIQRIEDYERWCVAVKDIPPKKRKEITGEDAGDLLEEIVYLAFESLRCITTIKSFDSFASQIDLLVRSSDFDWVKLLKYLNIEDKFDAILIEAKNTDSKVEDKQFGRFCGLLQYNYPRSVQLGIIVARNGATGFPESGKNKQSLTAAQATQILFHARTNKYVVVFDQDDILRLREPDFLPRILEAKIRAIEAWTGRIVKVDKEGRELDILPAHLQKYNLRK